MAINNWQSDREPLAVVVRRPALDIIMESAFIHHCLLGGLGRPWQFLPIESNRPVPAVGNALYISYHDDMVPALRTALARGYRNIGGLHLGDEYGNTDRAWYAEVDYVLRHYWHPDAQRLPPGCRCREVMWIPNGYRFGVGPRLPQGLLPCSRRKVPLFFSGMLNTPPRQAMARAVEQGQVPAVMLTTEGWGKGLGPASYGAWLENSRFALVPQGAADETIRLFDALECGTIPVSLRAPFLNAPQAMGGCPVVQLDSWDDLPGWYARMATAPAEILDELQERIMQWWIDFKAYQQCRVANVIEAGFSN